MKSGFVQALLLTSVFHKRLSFMAIGQNPMCVSMLAIATGSSYGGAVSPTLLGPGEYPWKLWLFHPSQVFK